MLASYVLINILAKSLWIVTIVLDSAMSLLFDFFIAFFKFKIGSVKLSVSIYELASVFWPFNTLKSFSFISS